MGDIDELKKNHDIGAKIVAGLLASVSILVEKKMKNINKIKKYECEYNDLMLENASLQNQPFGKFRNREAINNNYTKMHKINERRKKL